MALSIGFLVFPKVQPLDLVGPYDLFATLPGVTQHLVWKDTETLVGSTGLLFRPTATFTDCPPLDILCVPGGAGVDPLMEDGDVLDFLRERAPTVRFLGAICTGSLVLGAAGLLRGRRATTHWASHHLLAPLGAVPVEERVVRDGALVCGGGVTAGIDFALGIVEAALGREAAETAQLAIEYAPAPPTNAGRPQDASPDVVEAARARLAATIANRERIVARLSAAWG